MPSQQPHALSERECAQLIPKLDGSVNKYTRGCVGVLGGSAAYPGAPVLAALAAARTGAGYVRLVAPEQAAKRAYPHLLSIPVTGCAQGKSGTLSPASIDQAELALEKSDVVLVGCGMGASRDAVEFLSRMDTDRPLVIDADALNILSAHPGAIPPTSRHARVLTPHEGEAARLLGRPVHDRCADARELACRYEAVVLLKGPETLVAAPDGRMRAIREGGPELAKAGTGDVLAGMIAAFFCQGLDPLDAASLAAFAHGRAGKRAACELSPHAVMPEDIINQIGPTLLSLEATRVS